MLDGAINPATGERSIKQFRNSFQIRYSLDVNSRSNPENEFNESREVEFFQRNVIWFIAGMAFGITSKEFLGTSSNDGQAEDIVVLFSG